MAQAAISDGSSHPELVRLSSIGTSGKHKSNAERDWHRFLRKSAGTRLQPFFFKVPGPDGREVQCAVVLPHEL
eukprot:5431858-Alexandrium_andersonii.AAC.1